LITISWYYTAFLITKIARRHFCFCEEWFSEDPTVRFISVLFCRRDYHAAENKGF
jgi:hypothetical protein